jgi:uncharacterized protein (TIGR00730 family)
VTGPIVAVFGSSKVERDDAVWGEAERLGRLLVLAGAQVATGGYAGLMEAVSAGAAAAGGRPIGVTAPAVFPARAGANGYVAREIPAPTLPQRIARIVEIADASVALPGSIGTLAELLVAWNDAFVAPFRGAAPRPVVAVGSTWSRLIDQIGGSTGADTSFVTCVDEVDAVIPVLAAAVPGIIGSME